MRGINEVRVRTTNLKKRIKARTRVKINEVIDKLDDIIKILHRLELY